jgi:hypothetical protein
LHCLLRGVNRRRQIANYELLSVACLRMRRRVVKPFSQRGTPLSGEQQEAVSEANAAIRDRHLA